MATSKLARACAETRQLEAQAQRFRGEDSGRRDDGDEHEKKEKRRGITSLLELAHEATTSLEDDLESLRNRLNPVLDDSDSDDVKDGKDDDSAIASAILQLQRLVHRIENASAAIRFLTDNARI